MTHLYTLQEPDFKTPVFCSDPLRWAAWMAGRCMSRRVAQDAVGEAWISTIFTGVGPGPMWESMVFGGAHDKHQRRYQTWDEARQGHDEIVAKLTRGEQP